MTTLFKGLKSSTASRTALSRHPVLATGSKLLFDFTNTYCNFQTDGLLSSTTVFRNLVTGAANAYVNTPTATNKITNVRTTLKGIKAASTSSGSSQQLYLGTGYELASPTNDYLASIWITIPTSPTASSFSQLFLLGTASSSENINHLFYFDVGTGSIPRGGANAAGTSGMADFTGFTAGSPHQIAVKKVGNTRTLLLDGVAITASSSVVGASTLTTSAFIVKALSANNSSIVHSYYLEDLTVSGRTAETALAIDYSYMLPRLV